MPPKTAPVANAAPVAKKTFARNPELHRVYLVSAKGGEQLKFTALKGKDGRFISFGFHNVLDGKKLMPGKGRGATQYHADFPSAKAAVDSAVTKALSVGWIRKPRVGGPGLRPDAFDIRTIPAPTK
jgi:hypothetical protein